MSSTNQGVGNQDACWVEVNICCREQCYRQECYRTRWTRTISILLNMGTFWITVCKQYLIDQLQCLFYWFTGKTNVLIVRVFSSGVAQWVARLTRNVEVVGSSPIKGPRCFPEQENLRLLLSTGWFQERIRAWFHNRTKINWGPDGRLT